MLQSDLQVFQNGFYGFRIEFIFFEQGENVAEKNLPDPNQKMNYSRNDMIVAIFELQTAKKWASSINLQDIYLNMTYRFINCLIF